MPTTLCISALARALPSDGKLCLVRRMPLGSRPLEWAVRGGLSFPHYVAFAKTDGDSSRDDACMLPRCSSIRAGPSARRTYGEIYLPHGRSYRQKQLPAPSSSSQLDIYAARDLAHKAEGARVVAADSRGQRVASAAFFISRAASAPGSAVLPSKPFPLHSSAGEGEKRKHQWEVVSRTDGRTDGHAPEATRDPRDHLVAPEP